VIGSIANSNEQRKKMFQEDCYKRFCTARECCRRKLWVGRQHHSEYSILQCTM